MALWRWVLILMVAGCTADESADAGRQPAAGIIEPEPFLTLGYDGALADQPFVGISGVHRLPDGNTVIADAAQMLWFDSAGQLVRSAGSAGRSRDIRRDILWMRGYRGDSVIAYDAASGELSVWAADGSLARSFQLTTDRADIRWVTADSVKMVRGPKQWARGRAERIPTYSRLLVDSERFLWAQSGDGSRAALFDQLNNFIGAIDVPTQLQIHQVGVDFVVGVIDEADGVGRVQIHRLHRAAQ